jgi:hypothetical protein
MNLPQKHHAEVTKICDSLRKALTVQPEECRRIITQTLGRAERLSESIASAPAKLGSKGGKKTAERGSEWFRQLAAKRKTHAGGRPKKAVDTTSDSPSV